MAWHLILRKDHMYNIPEKNDMKESEKEQRINAALMKRSHVSQTIAQGPYMYVKDVPTSMRRVFLKKHKNLLAFPIDKYYLENLENLVIYVAKFFKYFRKEKLKITLLSKLSPAADSLLSSHLANRSLVLSLESI